MTRSDIQSIAALAARKRDLSLRSPARFVTRAAMAGAFIFIGTLFSTLTAAWFYVDQPGLARLLGAFAFSTGLILIVLLGAEPFTGSSLAVGLGLYEGTVAPLQAARLWGLCWCGNLLGILILSLLFAASGASRELAASYLALTVPGRLALPWYQLLLRGALCGPCVCLGMLAGLKLKNECAKVIVVSLAAAAFLQAGLELPAANMASFALYTLLVDAAHLGGMAWNLLWVSLGNLLGGAVLLALPLWYMAQPDS